ncbi:hypothetical protein [Micrococcus luteus]|uniref:hypothetical protein n=1 Tax=Micrococcus luteus TaxID=1270 RepID=UPI00066503E5|nr:hypothetical protein [Micrococcus luteus]MBN6749472.1 hypothetical protein [Micrococcus luteus]MBN6759470.1 hypothetical protein [Micrococcus luteus]MBN6800809.1 hypothetical protein [Micrococcus luteus]TKD53505.1 hypothetical protein FBF74_10950 [Micrococcus luteus]
MTITAPTAALSPADLEADQLRATALRLTAARARARYKRLARTRRGRPSDLVAAMHKAVELSCQRQDLLERLASDWEAIAHRGVPGYCPELLRQAADQAREAADRCEDITRLRI